MFPLTPPNIGTAANTITLRPAASGLSVVSANAGPAFHLNGSKYFTIDGRIGGEGDGKDLVISNTSTNQGYCLKFSNDACYNTLRYCRLKGVNTSVSSGGVVIFAGSTGQTGNDNNLIEYCDLGDGLSAPSNIIISNRVFQVEIIPETQSHTVTYLTTSPPELSVRGFIFPVRVTIIIGS